MDKKLYVLADDGGGEMINVAISMTCPKTNFSLDKDEFSDGNFGQPDVFQPAEITSEEMDNVRKLIKEFNL